METKNENLLGGRVSWGLGLTLGAIALVRPIARISMSVSGVQTGPWLPLTLTAAITVLWALAIGLRARVNALLTALVAGLGYAVFAIVLSGIVSPIVDGRLEGPLANPIAIVPMLITNAVWGLIAGALALVVRAVQGHGAGR